jgi:hypothetical protein
MTIKFLIHFFSPIRVRRSSSLFPCLPVARAFVVSGKQYIMKPLLFFLFTLAVPFSGISQDAVSVQVPCITIDNKMNGHVLFSYKIPSDGFYTFSVTGGMLPKQGCTIYYYEYLFQLVTAQRHYTQETYNIASQAQDGDICYFQSNEKNNSVSGTFMKDEVVEMRLVLLKSEVNGLPAKKLHLTKKTTVHVEKNRGLVMDN